MIRTALKTAVAHRVRLAMTAVAIVLGVAFVSGTFVFTDTINARFETLFDDVYAGVDATVRPVPPEFGAQQGTVEGSLPESLVAEVAGIDGVDVAAGSVAGFAQIVAPDGEPIGGQGPPTLGFSWVEQSALSAVSIEEANGRPPSRDGEVVIDVGTAEANGFSLGDTVSIQTVIGLEPFEIVGLANFGTEDNLAGATLAIFSFEEGQRVFDLEGRVSGIDVLAADGVEPGDLVERITPIAPEGAEVVTGDQQTQEQLDAFTEGIGFLTTALLAFAAVAVFVGAFVIHNTFRIIVAQRARELALLRAIGATGRQLTSMVAIEALAISVVASAVGVLAGTGLATGIKAAMNAAGLGIPDGPLTVEPRTIVVGMSVGVVVTLASSLMPAWRAASVPPVAAMREAQPPSTRRSLRGRAVAGGVVSLLGSAGVGAGLMLENGASLVLVGIGSLVIFLGVSVLAPIFAIPIARILGRPLPGVTGALARDNTIRQPRRTASTAAALMIGVALVSFVGIFASSIKASVSETLEGAFPADLSFSSTNFSVGVSPLLEARLEELAGFETVSSVRTGYIRIDGEELNVAAFAPDVERVYDMGASIDPSSVGDGMLVAEAVAEERGWAVGDSIEVEFATTGATHIEVVGTFEDQTFANYLVSTATYEENFTSRDASITLARLDEGVSVDQARAAAAVVLADFPNVDVNTRSEQIAEAEAEVDSLVNLFSGLLGLAVIIAVIGIANTLSLSVFERTREIGLLRAIGMSRRQVRRMIRGEAIIVALFGAVLGVSIGTGLGWAVVSSLADDGLGTFAVPTGRLVLWLGLAGVAGAIAASMPARRGARMNVLRAISHQ